MRNKCASSRKRGRLLVGVSAVIHLMSWQKAVLEHTATTTAAASSMRLGVGDGCSSGTAARISSNVMLGADFQSRNPQAITVWAVKVQHQS
jgi:hypothetical protein